MTPFISKLRNNFFAGFAAASVFLLAACSSGDPLDPGSASTDTGDTLVVASQAYYSNEIIAEAYAQSLEAAGFTVNRQMRIGQREVYMPEMMAGLIDVIPEYSGNLFQYFSEGDTPATLPSGTDLEDALSKVLPQNLRALPAAAASDQDSYNVSADFAAQHNLRSLADLAKVPGPITVAANSELAVRPYGPKGLEDLYGIKVQVHAVEDSGGPLTLRALLDGTVQLADIYSADPAIAANDLVTLEDPLGLILEQNVVPIVSMKVNKQAQEAINKVSTHLDTATLQRLNAQSIAEEKPASAIAKEWLDTLK
ncbi:MAG: ABC transporter substrate-binding protein [Actinomycetaceae bacterium]|nr:ABC transporter substrate-binding protein [Actinomycetaceae bacterium]